MRQKGRINVLLKTLFLSLVITVFLMFLSSLPGLGYSGRTLNVEIKGEDNHGNLYVLANCEVTYNPVLYPLSWLIGSGRFSGRFYFISAPLYGASPSGEFSPHRFWPSRYELMQQALDSLVFHHLSVNAIFMFIVVLVSSFFHIYDLYLCVFVSAIFFPLAGLMGTITAFFSILLISIFVKVILKRDGLLVELWNSIG